MRRFTLRLFAASLVPFATGCAWLHHAQVGEIDDTRGTGQYFDLKVSETGVDLEEAGRIVDALSRSNKGSEGAGYLGLIQMGPTTGNPVYTEDYAENIIDLLRAKCPSGRITGLTSIRESRDYPVISGEIVKITGYCLGGK